MRSPEENMWIARAALAGCEFIYNGGCITPWNGMLRKSRFAVLYLLDYKYITQEEARAALGALPSKLEEVQSEDYDV